MASKKTSKKAATKKAATESKADKFVRLAEQRTTKAINAVRGIGRLASSNYEYTPEQAQRICEALKAEVVELHERFSKKEAPKAEGFKLS